MYRKPLQTTTYGIAVFNLFAAFIYRIALVDKSQIEGKIRVSVQIAFIVVFAVLEFILKVVLLPAGDGRIYERLYSMEPVCWHRKPCD